MNDILIELLGPKHYLAKLTKPSEMWHVEVDYGNGLTVQEFGATKEQALERMDKTLAEEYSHAQKKLDHVNKCWMSIRASLRKVRARK